MRHGIDYTRVWLQDTECNAAALRPHASLAKSARLRSVRRLDFHCLAPVFVVVLDRLGCRCRREAPRLPLLQLAVYDALLHDKVVDDVLGLVDVLLALAALLGHAARSDGVGRPCRHAALYCYFSDRLGRHPCVLHRLEADNDLAVARVGVLFTHRRGAVGDDARRLPLLERPAHLDGLGGGHTVSEVLGQRRKALLAQAGGLATTDELAG
jgi:hypothetical protein